MWANSIALSSLTWSKVNRMRFLQRVPNKLTSKTRVAHLCQEAGKGSFRKNELGLQMIPRYLQSKIFGDNAPPKGTTTNKPKTICVTPEEPLWRDEGSKQYSTSSSENLCRVKDHLSKHDIWNKKHDTSKFPIDFKPEVIIDMPELKGRNIEEHFQQLGTDYSAKYKELADKFCQEKSLINPPESWVFRPGWTKYQADESGTMNSIQIDYPEDQFLVLDVETCVKENNRPVMCTAFSRKHWYSW